MEKLVKTGKVKAIGVSNFNIRRMEDLLSKTTVVPAALQVEAHPYLLQPDLLEYCQKHNIILEAYSPLGNNSTGEQRTVDDPLVHDIAKQLNMDPGAVLASWAIQRGTVVLPKSVTPKRIADNLKVKELPSDAFEKLNGLERHKVSLSSRVSPELANSKKRFNFPIHWGYDIFDEAGEVKVKKAAQDSAKQNKTKFTN